MMTKNPIRSIVVCACAACVSVGFAGDINPPAGPVAGTMKTLDEVEPRTPINGNTTPGDATASFVISAPGSYYLAKNFKGENAKAGIRVEASNVSIDLMGFEFAGVPGSLDGIVGTSGTTDLSVVDGKITSWDGDGIDGDVVIRCRVERVHSNTNGFGAAGDDGINVGPYSIVSHCIANSNAIQGVDLGNHSQLHNSEMSFNGVTGVQCSPNCAIHNCVARSNPTNGIRGSDNTTIVGCAVERNGGGISADQGSLISNCSSGNNTGTGISIGASDSATITNCTAFDNGGWGFSTGQFVTVSECTAMSNFSGGFQLSFDGTVTNCTASQNNGLGFSAGSGRVSFRGCSALGNFNGGMSLFDGCAVRDCTVSGNFNGGITVASDCKVVGNLCEGNTGTGFGIQVTGSDCVIEGNTLTDNVGNGIDAPGTGNLIIKNTASGNGVNYGIAAGNAVGAILNVSGANITTSIPWRNLEF